MLSLIEEFFKNKKPT